MARAAPFLSAALDYKDVLDMMMEKLRSDLLEARRNKNEVRRNLLTALVGEATAVGKNSGDRPTTDGEVLALVRKFIKNAKDTLAYLNGKNATTQEELARSEIAFLEGYLPKQMTEDELTETIKDIIAELGGTVKMGAIMATLKERYDGLYDARAASGMLKSLL